MSSHIGQRSNGFFHQRPRSAAAVSASQIHASWMGEPDEALLYLNEFFTEQEELDEDLENS